MSTVGLVIRFDYDGGSINAAVKRSSFSRVIGPIA